VEDDDYRIHYTITSPAFRRLYFSAVEMNNTCKAAEIFGANESYSVGRVVERELSVLNEGKEKWAFETDVFSNGLQDIPIPPTPTEQQEVTIPLFNTSR
jgi:hypothetical protein